MKKKALFTVLPLVMVAGCATSELAFTPYLGEYKGLPAFYVQESNHVTYLMLGMFGQVNVAGASSKGDVAEKFYENTVVWVAEPGTPLPTKDEVTSSVANVIFRGWAYYDENNENVYPNYYSVVPTTSELALKAIFDGPSGGGGGSSSGGQVDVTNITFTVTDFPTWIPNDGSTVFAWTWGGASGNGEWHHVTLHMTGEDGNYSNVTGTFEAPNNITGFNMARCVYGTSAPNWQATGDNVGRVYNKSGDVTVTSGVTSYSSPDWQPYTYNP